MSELSILYKEDGLVVVNKPPRIAVHRSAATANDVKFLLQELRNQVDCHVHPIHRLDRGTSGCILFATRQEWVPELSKQFQDNQVQKQYQAIVRGHAPETIEVDYALKVKS